MATKKRYGIVLLTVLIMTALTELSDAQVQIVPDDMMETVKYLSTPDIKSRGLGSPALDHVAALIADRFEAVGLLPGGYPSGSWYQEWVDPESRIRMRNVVGLLPGRNPGLAGQSVVIGAHYDYVGVKETSKQLVGKILPTAEDNASGVAVLLELVSRLSLLPDMERSILFVAFTGKEAGRKGSRYYVRNEKRYPVAKTVGMINLDSVGHLGKNTLLLLGARTAKEWAPLFQEASRPLKLEIAESTQDLVASDQISFHEAGIPAVQVSTEPPPDADRSGKPAAKIDGNGLVKIATITRAVAFTLANLPGPLTKTITAAPDRAQTPRMDPKATIGAIPDLTYNEKGVRIGSTEPGGPSDTAGLRERDIIIQAGNMPINVLKDLSELLKSKQPGMKLPVTFLRNGKEMKAELELKER